MSVPSANTIDLLMARDLSNPKENLTDKETDDIVKYYRWLRAQSDAGERPKKDDLPKKSAKEFLEKMGALSKKPQEEVRRA